MLKGIHFTMSGNYVQLQNKARDVIDATTLLRTRKTAQISADKEAAQAKVSYDLVVSDYERRKAQATASDEDMTKTAADIVELRALRASLITQKATAITVRDEAADAVEAKETEILDILGEPVTADPMASPPIVGQPSRGIHALEAGIDPHREAVDTLNQGIVTKRISLESLRAVLSALKKELQDLKDVRDSMPPSEVPQELRDEIAAKEDEVDAKEYEISSLEAEIEVDLESVSVEEAYIDTLMGQIEDLMSDYRAAQRDLEELRITYQEALSEFQDIANQLEDIEGSADPSEATVDANSAEADGEIGSRLRLTVESHDRMMSINSEFVYLRDHLNDAKIVRKTALDAANRKKTTAEREVASAEEDLARLRRDLAVLIANQGNIEVEAAASLLEDFLKNGSVIVSAAPVVDVSVERDIAKTCEDSKVRSLVSRIRAAYLDEDEYKALRLEFRADPVGSFFNTINDPCFALLSEEEVEALRANIKANFSRRAAALFAKYFPTRSGGTTSTRNNTRTWVLTAVVVVFLAVALYLIKFH